MFQNRMQSKTNLTDSARKMKVSQIAASMEAAVKSAESTLKLPKPIKQLPSSTPLPIVLPRPKLTSKKLPPPTAQSETAVINYNHFNSFKFLLSLFDTKLENVNGITESFYLSFPFYFITFL